MSKPADRWGGATLSHPEENQHPERRYSERPYSEHQHPRL